MVNLEEVAADVDPFLHTAATPTVDEVIDDAVPASSPEATRTTADDFDDELPTVAIPTAIISTTATSVVENVNTINAAAIPVAVPAAVPTAATPATSTAVAADVAATTAIDVPADPFIGCIQTVLNQCPVSTDAEALNKIMRDFVHLALHMRDVDLISIIRPHISLDEQIRGKHFASVARMLLAKARAAVICHVVTSVEIVRTSVDAEINAHHTASIVEQTHDHYMLTQRIKNIEKVQSGRCCACANA